MLKTGLKHNRKRNAGLVYEFLVRQMATCMLENDRKGFESVQSIVQRHFGTKSPMASELKLFDTIRTTRGQGREVARRVLGEVQRASKDINRRTLSESKDRLIHEINRTLGKDFFGKHRLDEYRLLASIQLMLDGAAEVSHDARLGQIYLTESLVDYMSTNEEYRRSEFARDEIDGLVCALAAKSFMKRYEGSLSKSQLSLLEGFMRAEMSGDHKVFVQRLVEERTSILSVLSKRQDDPSVKADPVMKERFDEAFGRLNELKIEGLDESVLQELLLFKRLVEELESND